jgi:hypothetical protein
MHPWIPPWNGNLSAGQASSSPIAVHLVRGLVHVWVGALPVVQPEQDDHRHRHPEERSRQNHNKSEDRGCRGDRAPVEVQLLG